MKYITDLLEDAGYEAIHAFSAETAIEQTEMAKPSLILIVLFTAIKLAMLSAPPYDKEFPLKSN